VIELAKNDSYALKDCSKTLKMHIGFSHLQAFSFEMGHFWPVKMARLAGVCMGQKWPA